MICMAHITLSIPDEVYKEIKKHPEIKWSEVARQSIIEKITLLRSPIKARDVFKLLPFETQRSIKAYSPRKEKELYKKLKQSERRRVKLISKLSRN